MQPFKAEINQQDWAILHKMRLERFVEVLADPSWYSIDLQDDTLLLEARSTTYVDMTIKGFDILMDAAYLILGAKSISLYCTQEWIADYYKDIVDTRDRDMIATLEREVQGVANNAESSAPQSSSVTPNNDYISLDQLRAMAVEISGENEELLAWMEQNNVTIPTRFMAGVPRYQTKAIFKAATDWNNAKIQSAMSRYLGIGNSSQAAEKVTSQNNDGTTDAPSSGLKLLRTPSGFKATKTGRDKYSKTVKALIAAIPSERWMEYQQHILSGDEMGTAFVTRLSKQFDEKDAFAKLLEAFQEEAGVIEQQTA